MKSKNIWKYGFNWGTIIGAVYFLHSLIGHFAKLEASFFWSLLGSFIIIFGLIWTLSNYRKNIVKQNVSFGRFFAIGTIMSLFISLFFTLFMALYIIKLNPTFFDNFLIQYQDIFDSMGIEIDVFENEEFLDMVKVVFFPSSYISNFIGNLFYLLLISFLLSRPSFGAMRQAPRPPMSNDYVPYKETKNEEEKVEEIEESKESSEEENKDS